MKYRYLGGSGLLVSRISLGTMTFGAAGWGCDEKEAHDLLKRYLEAGGNSIDTADVYAGGRSEEIVGGFLSQVGRDEVILASKFFFPMGGGPNGSGSSRKHLLASCEASLRRLRTDYLDLYYIHGPDPVTPMEETLRALDDLVRQGKVRYLGCSNLFGWQIAKAAGIAARLGYTPLVAGQYLYNLIHREPEREIIPSAVDHGLGLVTYSPLGAGLLTGKYEGMKEPAAGTRLAHRTAVDGPRFWHPRGFEAAAAVKAVAASSGLPAHRLAIGWPLRRRFVASVIIGARNAEQLARNLEPGDLDLPEETWAQLEEKTRPAEEYLSWFNRANYNRRFGAAEFHEGPRELP